MYEVVAALAAVMAVSAATGWFVAGHRADKTTSVAHTKNAEAAHLRAFGVTGNPNL
ncbi:MULTISPECIES: hypothetical protein [unclassified Methylobacterium]|uniref:hypothetical protein n=1 Tax=unclassified Methylobacterium TaxID=2615210 RepID=UPI002269B6CA|nr:MULTISPECIES: hypothetical protein [unclassified Methylobacterium]